MVNVVVRNTKVLHRLTLPLKSQLWLLLRDTIACDFTAIRIETYSHSQSSLNRRHIAWYQSQSFSSAFWKPMISYTPCVEISSRWIILNYCGQLSINLTDTKLNPNEIQIQYKLGYPFTDQKSTLTGFRHPLHERTHLKQQLPANR